MPGSALGPAGFVTNRGDRDALAHNTVIGAPREVRHGHRCGKRHETAAEDVLPLATRPCPHEHQTSSYPGERAGIQLASTDTDAKYGIGFDTIRAWR